MAMEQQVSAANRRLAQQLANRPGLQNSPANIYQNPQTYRGGRQGNANPVLNKRSLQQRLGKSNIKNRLSLPGGQPMRGRGRGRGRGGSAPPIQGGGGDNQWNPNRGKGRGGFSPRGPRGRGTFRGRGRGNYNRFTGQNTLNRRGRGVARGNNRGMKRGGRGQGRGRGAGGRGGNSNINVQELDNQLDEYMARTKTHLDAELDAYMSEVNN